MEISIFIARQSCLIVSVSLNASLLNNVRYILNLESNLESCANLAPSIMIGCLRECEIHRQLLPYCKVTCHLVTVYNCSGLVPSGTISGMYYHRPGDLVMIPC